MALQFDLCVLILAFSLCHGSITNKPADIEACVNEDVNIPWTYDDNDVGTTVAWSHEGTTIMTYFGSGGSHISRNSYNVVNHGTGNITLSSVPTTYTGSYKIAVSGGTNSNDLVDVTVCAASARLTSSKSGQTITCAASDLGTPAAALTIWIDGVEQSSSSATVTDLNEVSCCLSGCAVSCMNGGSSSATESCIVVQATTTTSPPDSCECTVCAIILLIQVIIVAAAIIVIAYLLYNAKTDGDNHGDDHGVSTSAIVGIVIGILAAVGIIVNIIVCVVTLEPNCSLSCEIPGFVIGPIDVIAIIAVIVYVIITKQGVCNGKVLPFGICGDADGKVNDIENNSKDKKQDKTPTGAAHGREESQSVVSKQDVVIEKRPIPDIPKNNKFRGLSANLEDNNYMTGIDLPAEPKPKNALEPIEPVPKKKKKRKKAKKDAPDSQRTEDEQE